MASPESPESPERELSNGPVSPAAAQETTTPPPLQADNVVEAEVSFGLFKVENDCVQRPKVFELDYKDILLLGL